MGKTYKIIIVDDNQTFLDGLSSMLKRRKEFEIIGQYTSGMALLDDDKYGMADIILLDIEMPELNGLETARQLNFHNAQLKIIAITMYQEQLYLQQLIEAGFKGFVNKTMTGESLFQVIDEVIENKFSFPMDIGLLDEPPRS